MDSLMQFGLLALMSGEDFLWWLRVVPMVAVGLGAVIFVHELGHFLVAKACGVKCEKFMIGFDIGGYKIARKWGETLYGIGILPLGGYVKMLGQDDDPAHIAEQMQKSQIDAKSTDAKAIKGPSGETYYVDRRSYLAKSVPQRMAIISAGVIMNIIFAFIFAVIAYGMGVEYMPSIVGGTVAGSPAWMAELEPGDEIIEFAGQPNPTFIQLMSGVTLGDTKNGAAVKIRRAADGEIKPVTLTPKQQQGQLAKIGVSPMTSLELMEELPAEKHSPAAAARLVAPPESELRQGKPKLESGDTIVRVGETPVENYRDFAAVLAAQPDKPLEITVVRPLDAKSKQDEGAFGQADSVQMKFEVPPQPLRDFGIVMKIGPITAVQPNSPGFAAGLKADDVIESVDGKMAGEPGGWTPDTLPDLMRQAATEKREVELIVIRGAKEGAAPDRVTVRVTPRLPRMFYTGAAQGGAQGVEALGIAYRIENEIASVQPNSPAAGKFAAGDQVLLAKIQLPPEKKTPDAKAKARRPIDVRFAPQKPGFLGRLFQSIFGGANGASPTRNWPMLISMVQFIPEGTEVEFTVERKGGEEFTTKLVPTSTEGAYDAARGFVFEPIKRTRTATSFSEQVRLGWDETVDALTMVVRFLKKLGTQVPATMLGGPGTIAAAAGHHASEGIASLLIFLTMLSANLAVINFLPIPLLDGGHMVFLAYEGLRGRPANERVVIALHTAGFVFIIGLMLFVIGLDIQRWLF
jgi:regulator of sigma E protease